MSRRRNGLDACLNLNCSCTYAARGLADWRRSSCMDGSLGQRMTNADPISKPIDLTLQNSSRSNGLIAKKNISYPSTNLWNPKLKAEINGIVASRCVWRPRSPHEIISCLHMMSISTSCSSHVPFERSGHT